MKKISSAVLAAICLVCFAACGKTADAALAARENPQKIVVTLDSEGYQREICFTDAEEIAGFMELYNRVELGEMTDMMTTDSYNLISFYYGDGSCEALSINGDNLEKEVDGQLHYFEPVNLGPLWAYIENHGTVTD